VFRDEEYAIKKLPDTTGKLLDMSGKLLDTTGKLLDMSRKPLDTTGKLPDVSGKRTVIS
jgi:hypothetical protein